MEEDAVVEELVDVIVIDVQIVAEDLMALKMRLLVVDAVVRLIKEDVDVGVGVGVGVVELVTLIVSSLLMLLKMVTTTMNLLLFWAFRIKRLEASYVSSRVQGLPEGGARNIKLTDDMQAFIRDFVLQQPFSTIAAVGQELAARFPDTPISNEQFRFPVRHLQNQLITTKIAGKDSDVPYERNRPNIIQ